MPLPTTWASVASSGTRLGDQAHAVAGLRPPLIWQSWQPEVGGAERLMASRRD